MAEQLLQAESIPLKGLHLIEASAGTGKTYNITRLYLRLLIEQKLTVEQILVMTFTKDATQELKGRIDDTIRDALQNWSSLIIDDPFYQVLGQQISEQEAKLLLKRALLFIDEAAIFTIHGFCQRVLNQYAFNAQISLDATLSPDMQTPMLQAVQDWYRQLASQDEQAFIELTSFWQTPEKFIESFAKAILQNIPIKLIDSHAIKQGFLTVVKQALDDIESANDLLYQVLIDSKKGKDRDTRISELEQLKLWLTSCLDNFDHSQTDIPIAFADGRRFSRSPHKAELVEVFSKLTDVKKMQGSLAQDLAKAQAYVIASTGISQIKQLICAEKSQQNVLGFDDLVEKLAQCVKSDNALAEQLFNDYPVALVDEFQDTDSAQYTIINEIYGQQDDACVFMIGDPKQAIYGFRGGDVFAYLQARQQCQFHWVMDTNWRSSQGMINAYNRLFYGNVIDQAPNDVFKYNIAYQPVNASPKAKPELVCQQQYKPLQIIDFVSDAVVKQTKRVDMAMWCANEINRLLNEENSLSAKDFAILVRDGGEARQIKKALDDLGLASVFLSNRENLFDSNEARQLYTLLRGVIELENEQYYSAALTTQFLGYHADAYLALQQDEMAWQAQRQTFETLRDVWLSQGFMPMALTFLHDYFRLSSEQKDRLLTNVLHLFEILQEASSTHRLPQELLFWFEQQLNANTSANEAELRLESDANLIKIVTQHGSKGLEYPVVFVPFATRYKNPLRIGSRNVSLIEYHEANGDKATSLGGNDEQKQAMLNEAHAEAVRLLYVAITRAEQRCYLLASNFEQAAYSPLGLTLGVKASDNLSQTLIDLANSQSDIGYQAIDFIDVESAPIKPIETQEQQVSAVKVAEFIGKIERDWWLSSFTALSRNMRHQGISAPDRDEVDVEQVGQNTDLSLRFTLTKGAQAGNLLHEMLEYNRFDAPNWHDGLVKNQHRYQDILSQAQIPAMASWLDEIVTTPLAQQLQETNAFCLADIDDNKTIRECEFYFPMEQAKLSALIELLTKHRQTNPYRTSAYNKRVYLPFIKQLKGMMHGFIDLVFEHNGKYYVCDYKSSHLGEQLKDYRSQVIAHHVEEHHYDLQYLIYCLALHRYLSTQLPDYKVAEHFGGIYYLYLRGMSPTSEENTGVYYRDISENELTQLDKIFASATNTVVGATDD
ncbi:exodeoxyribonuclease V subunit beta [Thalassotalea sp. LPB0316]|uniref:exodeoxyribonuclease V subunit beta n=1 Tax=Thalassotalea sp. LPB0316 TaxID=2769490 RepID=UPI001869097D|nr:exodeoxyribonuclease V subunit beta [Thalassotalea sp. LPB0316]QOL24946.1 exodeoxyribonuclease V subunit beta [Thalassotalea sp. LPB0316]